MTPGQEKSVFAALPFAPHRVLRRLVLLSALVCGLFALHGCGGSSGFTGGGVPIGKAALNGRLISAANPQLPLANAQISILATPNQSAAQTITTTTDANGMFHVTGIPTDAINGTVTVSAMPQGAAFLSQQVTFLIVNQHSANLIMALPPADYHFAPGTSLAIEPQSAHIVTGQSVQFSAHVVDASGTNLALVPTLLFGDDFGTLNDDGTFTATGSGTGDLLAFWYDGLRTSASIIVNTSVQTQPPTPPRAQRTDANRP